MSSTLFPFHEYWHFYGVFVFFVAFVLLIDLGVLHRKAREISFKEASWWTAIWISLALVFNVLFYFYCAWKFSGETAYRVALEFFTGFVVEKTLAVDNIFVFAVVFSYFSIPRAYQHRILFYGILGALAFRALFIALGSYLMAYHAAVVVFGVLLVITGAKMMLAPAKMMSPEKNVVIRLLRRLFRVHPVIDGDRFFVRRDGLLYVTPLFLALVFVEISDVIFAVDSVPAIFALTNEPLIVFTSNIFAILGLRSMYFMLIGVMDRFAYIKYGLAAVLIFVGLKMAWLNEAFGGKFPIGWSLAIIASLIASSVVFSLAVSRARR